MTMFRKVNSNDIHQQLDTIRKKLRIISNKNTKSVDLLANSVYNVFKA